MVIAANDDVIAVIHDGHQVALIINGKNIQNNPVKTQPTNIQIFHNGVEIYQMNHGEVIIKWVHDKSNQEQEILTNKS